MKSWMTPDPVTIDADASALAALEAMVDRGIRHLPVVDGRRVVGVLSFHDLRAALPVPIDLHAGVPAADRELLRGYSVGELMSCFPEVAHPETPLEDAAQRLAARRIGCLPVVDGAGALVGILSSTDALRALATSLWKLRARAAATREDELSALVDELHDERARIQRALGAAAREERELTDLAREAGGSDPEEQSAERFEIGLTAALRDHAARRLASIERALGHAAEGVLTVCDDCGGEIPLARLRALPGTTRCVACARAKER